MAIGYFSRFGVTERMIAEALSAALAPGRRLRRRLLPAQDRRRPGARGRRGQPRLRERRAGRRRPGRQGGPDRLRLHRGADRRRRSSPRPGPPPPSPTARRAPARSRSTSPRLRPTATRSSARGRRSGPARSCRSSSALEQRAFAADPRVRKVNAHLRDESGVVLIADSRGRLVEDRQPMTLLSLSCVAEQDGRREQNGYNVAARAGFEFYTPERLDRVVREAIARTTILFEAGPPPAGELPVVLAAGLLGHPAPRGDRPRHGGRLQPEGDVDLRRQDRQADRGPVREHRRRRHAAGGARLDQRGRRGERGRRDAAGGRRASSRPSCTTRSRRATTASPPPATAGARATATRRCRACARPTCSRGRTRRRRSSAR